MVLCAAETLDDGSEKVEFVEPPEGGEKYLHHGSFLPYLY